MTPASAGVYFFCNFSLARYRRSRSHLGALCAQLTRSHAYARSLTIGKFFRQIESHWRVFLGHWQNVIGQ